mmetsp:Transcript_9564/g.26027  ORF Transcript_9564/g.26027 Transcript_9564/m.26027 type:complete len:154 (-) Transcript_9564:1271-1732(-)
MGSTTEQKDEEMKQRQCRRWRQKSITNTAQVTTPAILVAKNTKRIIATNVIEYKMKKMNARSIRRSGSDRSSYNSTRFSSIPSSRQGSTATLTLPVVAFSDGDLKSTLTPNMNGCMHEHLQLLQARALCYCNNKSVQVVRTAAEVRKPWPHYS